MVEATPAEAISVAPIPTIAAAEPIGSEPAGAGWQSSLMEKLGALRQNRFAVLAGSAAFAGVFGIAIGAFGASEFRHAPMAPKPVVATNDMRGVTDTVAQIKSDIAALRVAAETVSRNTTSQLSKISEKVERIDRGQADPAARLAKISETVDRLDQRVTQLSAAAKDVTGSIAAPPPAPALTKPTTIAAAVPAAPPDQAKLLILEGWRLRNVYDGAALVQGRMGTIEVEPGDTLPGGGRVQEIRRQDGRWVVVTSKGLIVSMR